MSSETNQCNKKLGTECWRKLEISNGADVTSLVSRYMSAESSWYGPDPINQLSGPDELLQLATANYWPSGREAVPLSPF